MDIPKFFRITDLGPLDKHDRFDQRFRLDPNRDCKVCLQPIWFTAFFDGTGNNFYEDGGKNQKTLYGPDGTNYSNIAKLWRFTHQNVGETEDSGSKIKASYIEGVGTPCLKVGDSGEGAAKGLGMAAAMLGEKRIQWMLRELNEHVSRHLH